MILERITPTGRRVDVYVSPTPSPRARRFITEQPLRIGARMDFDRGDEMPPDISGSPRHETALPVEWRGVDHDQPPTSVIRTSEQAHIRSNT